MAKRECVIKGKAALFHTFEQYSEIVPPSLMAGGHSGGVLAEVFAIVEYEDGTVGRERISSLQFTDITAATDIKTAQPKPQPQRRKPIKEKTNCGHCQNTDNQNAVIYADIENKEYFVYCRTCSIETIETFKSKKAALSAFENGEIKEVAEDAKTNTTSR